MDPKNTLKDQLEDYLPQIRKVVQRIAKDDRIVDDIAQECCVRIIEKEKLWDGNTNKITQWINMVTKNLTIRKVSKHRKEQAKTHPLYNEGSTVLPEDEKFSEDHIKWVLLQFDHLSKRQKEILQMRYFKNMSLTDIGEELDITPQTASIHMKRAIDKLKQRAKFQGLMSLVLPFKWLSDRAVDFFSLEWISKTAIVTLSLTGTLYIGNRIYQSETAPLKSNSKALQNLTTPAMTNDIETRKIAEEKAFNQELSDYTLVDEEVFKKNIEKKRIKKPTPPAEVLALLDWLRSLDNTRFGRLKAKHLLRLEKLQFKDLVFEQKDLAKLQILPTLNELVFLNTNLDPIGLQLVNQIDSLESLTIKPHDQKRLSIKFMNTLCANQKLKQVSLIGLTLSKQEMTKISQLDQLRNLKLKNCRFPDGHLESLGKLKNLNHLEIFKSKSLNLEKVEQLQLKLPHCKITFNEKKETKTSDKVR